MLQEAPDSRAMMYRMLILAGFLWCGVFGAARAEVVVFAAASLKEPVDALAATFDDVTVSYGGSGTLARQISLGAPADVILLANSEWMTVLVEGDHVSHSSVTDFASNRLVVAGPVNADDMALEPEVLLEALGQGRLAVGLTNAVPAGIYAKAALQSLGLWEALSPRLAEVDNVRAALALVVRGQVPLAIVYETDVRVSEDVRALAVFPDQSHPLIRYQAAVVTHSPEADAFLAALIGEQGNTVLADAGFLPAVVAPQ